MTIPVRWIQNNGQRVWLRIGLLFGAFYFGEAILFWGPDPRVHAPSGTPLVYWGAFGAGVVWLLLRQRPKGLPAEDLRASQSFQAIMLGVGITAAVIGLPFFVMVRTGDITLGHVVLVGVLAQAAVVIGGMSGSLGWLAAGVAWACSGYLIQRFPALQDFTLGLAVTLGFIVIGLLRKCATPGGQQRP